MVLITIIGLSIGYSAYNQELMISGEAKFIITYDIAKNKILNDNGGKTYIENKEKPDFSVVANTNEGMFATLDNNGTSYYYRGAVENNWLYFAGYYWRIVRINGNGSIRIIYNGTTTNQTGKDTQIGTSIFNTNYNDNAYVGYMYGTAGSDTYKETHSNINDSIIKQIVDNWYKDNLLNYFNYLDFNTGFCGDRTSSTYGNIINNLGGIKQEHTYYSSFINLYTNKNPTLMCINNNDYYTFKDSNHGNKSLIYPIGLLQADELVLAGAKIGEENKNSDFYLYTGNNYWTITPFAFYNFTGYAYDLFLTSDGFINNGYALVENVGVRPVINLKANIMLSGNGTIDNPYKVVNTS